MEGVEGAVLCLAGVIDTNIQVRNEGPARFGYLDSTNDLRERRLETRREA